MITLTAHAMEGDREPAMAAGMDADLAGPFKRTDLAEMLPRWISSA